MKISNLRTFQSVKCGKNEKTFLTSTEYDMHLDGQLIYITDRASQESVITPLANVPWFKVLKEVPKKETKPSGQSKSKKSTGRASKAPATKAKLGSE